MGRDNLPTEVLIAARDGNVTALKKFLKNGLSPDASNMIGQSALHFSSMWGRVDAVATLLDAGADVNIENDDGVTPLIYAARKGYVDVVRLLISRGARVHDLRMMLKYVKDLPQADEIQAVLQRHCRPNELTKSIEALDLKKMKELLDAGALLENETWEDLRGRTPLHYAVLAINSCVNRRVQQGKDDFFGDNEGLAALEMLVEAAERAGEYVLHDACNQLDDDGISPLHLLSQAGCAGHPAALALLLRSGADPNVQTMPNESEYTSGQWGRTTETGQKEVLEAQMDRTPLHMALEAPEPSTTFVRMLLQHRADPNVRDCEQRTALHLALDFEDDRGGIDLEICELLLQHGADPALGSHEIGMTNSCLHAAAANRELDVVQMLLRHGAPHSAPGKGGWTPLAIAARGGAAAVVEALLAAGADPDSTTPTGKTVRELATVNKKAEVVKALDRAAAAAPDLNLNLQDLLNLTDDTPLAATPSRGTTGRPPAPPAAAAPPAPPVNKQPAKTPPADKQPAKTPPVDKQPAKTETRRERKGAQKPKMPSVRRSPLEVPFHDLP